MPQKKTCVILVNYNSWVDTVECLESLFKLKESVEIVVVDNASTDDSIQSIRNWAQGEKVITTSLHSELTRPPIAKPLVYKEYVEGERSVSQISDNHFTLLISNRNDGFSSGNNLGIKFSVSHFDPKYFWLLNNDTVVKSNTLSKLIDFHEQSPKNIGVLGSTILYYDQPEIVQCYGGAVYNKWLGKSSLVGEGSDIKDKGIDAFNELSFVSGASMFVSSKYIKDVGLLGEEYFLYFEELDWIYRGKQFGYEIAFVPESIVYHKGGQSTGSENNSTGNSLLSDFYYTRNKIIFTKKHLGLLHLISIYLSFVLISMNRLLKGQWNRIPLLLSGLINPKKEIHR